MPTIACGEFGCDCDCIPDECDCDCYPNVKAREICKPSAACDDFGCESFCSIEQYRERKSTEDK